MAGLLHLHTLQDLPFKVLLTNTELLAIVSTATSFISSCKHKSENRTSGTSFGHPLAYWSGLVDSAHTDKVF